jgi:acyl dehydratase
MPLTITADTLQDQVGEEVGLSSWFRITQDDVNTFAEVTRDAQFIHNNPEQAAKTPFGGTIAHGFFTLSMLSHLLQDGTALNVEGTTMGINYGFDKVRFVSPVRVGKRVRGRTRLVSAEESKPNQFRMKFEVTLEIEGEEKPALVAEWLTMAV